MYTVIPTDNCDVVSMNYANRICLGRGGFLKQKPVLSPQPLAFNEISWQINPLIVAFQWQYSSMGVEAPKFFGKCYPNLIASYP